MPPSSWSRTRSGANSAARAPEIGDRTGSRCRKHADVMSQRCHRRGQTAAAIAWTKARRVDTLTRGMKHRNWSLQARLLVVVVFLVVGQIAILSPAWWSLPPFAVTMCVMMGTLAICASIVLALGRRARLALELLRRVSRLSEGWL